MLCYAARCGANQYLASPHPFHWLASLGASSSAPPARLPPDLCIGQGDARAKVMQQVEEAEDWRRARGEGCCEHPRQRRRRRRAQPRVLNREHLASGCSSYPVNINKNNEDGRLMRSLLMLVLVLMLRRAPSHLLVRDLALSRWEWEQASLHPI